ncbi:hypothetical protein C0992_003214, partial [Termitomyces sp. T32_za158]
LATPVRPSVKEQQKIQEKQSVSHQQDTFYELEESNRDQDGDYAPPAAPAEEESDSPEDGDIMLVSGQSESKQLGRKSKAQRDDISALRVTDIASGTGGKRKANSTQAAHTANGSAKKKRNDD